MQPGDSIDHYRIRRRIGTGGMGVVYEAVDTRLARRVAIKILRTDASRLEPQQALLREARAAACLEHERFVRVYAVDVQTGGPPYMVMEYLEGPTLREWLATARPISVVAGVFFAVCEGMAFAHRRGILHRDLKPENVVLTADGKVKILDLGLAALAEPPQFSTLERAELPILDNGRVGTPKYFAPEIWEGAMPTSGVDVWAIGVMLYEGLSGGRHPFWLGQADVLVNAQYLQSAKYQSLSKQPGQVPPALCDIVRRALAKKPEDRYPDAGELLAALRKWMHAAAISVPSSSFLSGGELILPAPRRGRHRRLATALSIALMALVVGVGVFTLVRTRLPAQLLASEMAEVPAGSFRMGSTPAELDAVLRWCYEETHEPRLCRREQAEREQPPRQVSISAFLMDRTEVTNAAFAAWLNRLQAARRIELSRTGRTVWTTGDDGVYLADLYPAYHPPHGLAYAGGQFISSPAAENMPVSQITWEAARMYCEEHGKRLPTEAEWEYAARGAGALGFRYPWGNDDPRCDSMVAARAEETLLAPDGATKSTVRLGCLERGIGPAPVATSPQDVSPQGVHDLGGNVSEWVFDPYVERYPDCGACKNPVVPESFRDKKVPVRSFRGGSWALLLSDSRAATRGRQDERSASRSIGFRCVKDKK